MSRFFDRRRSMLSGWLERRNLLLGAIFQHSKIVFGQIPDRLALIISDNNIEDYQSGAGMQGYRFLIRWRRLLGEATCRNERYQLRNRTTTGHYSSAMFEHDRVVSCQH